MDAYPLLASIAQLYYEGTRKLYLGFSQEELESDNEITALYSYVRFAYQSIKETADAIECTANALGV